MIQSYSSNTTCKMVSEDVQWAGGTGSRAWPLLSRGFRRTGIINSIYYLSVCVYFDNYFIYLIFKLRRTVEFTYILFYR